MLELIFNKKKWESCTSISKIEAKNIVKILLVTTPKPILPNDRSLCHQTETNINQPPRSNADEPTA